MIRSLGTHSAGRSYVKALVQWHRAVASLGGHGVVDDVGRDALTAFCRCRGWFPCGGASRLSWAPSMLSGEGVDPGRQGLDAGGLGGCHAAGRGGGELGGDAGRQGALARMPGHPGQMRMYGDPSQKRLPFDYP
jgi:hypothetical protein